MAPTFERNLFMPSAATRCPVSLLAPKAKGMRTVHVLHAHDRKCSGRLGEEDVIEPGRSPKSIAPPRLIANSGTKWCNGKNGTQHLSTF